MSTFRLRVSTPDGLLFDDQVLSLRARMIDGDVGLLAGHTDYVSAVGAGEACIRRENGETLRAACMGGMLSFRENEAHLIATTFEWADDIDLERARLAKERAEERIRQAKDDERELTVARAKLRRALVRIGVKG